MRVSDARAALQAFQREIERLAVVGREQQVADFAPGEALRQQVAQREEVAERLAHLLALDQQVRAVQPVLHEGLPGGCTPAPSLCAISSS